ncbi:MAG: hypothetical protein KUG64_10385 [Cycloclasticus sp.]|nr:hypothetical protein [Cycloclasticus sp.]
MNMRDIKVGNRYRIEFFEDSDDLMRASVIIQRDSFRSLLYDVHSAFRWHCYQNSLTSMECVVVYIDSNSRGDCIPIQVEFYDINNNITPIDYKGGMSTRLLVSPVMLHEIDDKKQLRLEVLL